MSKLAELILLHFSQELTAWPRSTIPSSNNYQVFVTVALIWGARPQQKQLRYDAASSCLARLCAWEKTRPSWTIETAAKLWALEWCTHVMGQRVTMGKQCPVCRHSVKHGTEESCISYWKKEETQSTSLFQGYECNSYVAFVLIKTQKITVIILVVLSSYKFLCLCEISVMCLVFTFCIILLRFLCILAWFFPPVLHAVQPLCPSVCSPGFCLYSWTLAFDFSTWLDLTGCLFCAWLVAFSVPATCLWQTGQVKVVSFVHRVLHTFLILIPKINYWRVYFTYPLNNWRLASIWTGSCNGRLCTAYVSPLIQILINTQTNGRVINVETCSEALRCTV